jgi:uroporphyrinogen decarboxylase
MEPRDRVIAALEHREADRVPRDLAGTRYSSIHAEAYARLRPALGLPDGDVTIVDISQGLAQVHEDVLARFGSDVAMVGTGSPSTYQREIVSDGEYERFVDEWGVLRARPVGGLYYESSSAPLAGVIGASDVAAFAWPDPLEPGRFAGMAERARHIREDERRAVFVGSFCAGVSEMHFRLRGYEDGYMDLAADPDLARTIMERVTELKLAYWGRVLEELGGLIDVAGEADDLGAQHAPLFSPRTYREIVKPFHAELVAFIKRRSRARFLLHSCGAIRDIIPDLIEIGVDCLNPVQVSATGMDTAGLKADFGRDLTFWGGTLDPQSTLARGTPDEVRTEVTRRVNELKPGGGFVFASIHNIQAHVPVENILAMWDALNAAGSYG